MSIEYRLERDVLDEVDGITVWPTPLERNPLDVERPKYEMPFIPQQRGGSIKREQLRIPPPDPYGPYGRREEYDPQPEPEVERGVFIIDMMPYSA